MQKTVKTEIRLKDGTSIPVGAPVSLRWDQSRPSTVLATYNGREIALSSRSLPRLGIALPSVRSLEKWSSDSICKSVLGGRVEPDGWDDKGSPSWLLALGLI